MASDHAGLVDQPPTHIGPATGACVIGGVARPGSGDGSFRAVDPQSGEETGPVVAEAGGEDLDEAIHLANEAFHAAHGSAPLSAMTAIADLIDANSVRLIEVCTVETGLAEARLSGELSRTSNQLRFLAAVARAGERLDATIDHADRARSLPDLRRVRVGLGPVAVFGASNFPFAFATLGGDTASALAAGCPVVVKGHEAHPATSELCALLMAEALERCALPPGWFALLQGRSHDLGRLLVTHPGVRAVGFTGSLAGGRALFDAAAARPDPIPVHAEMGSLNPVLISEAAARERPDSIAEAVAASISGSAGQLCTKPNLVVVVDSPAADGLVDKLLAAFSATEAAPMLTPGIRSALETQVAASTSRPGARAAARQSGGDEGRGLRFSGVLIDAELEQLLGDRSLRTEHFGPVAIVVRAPEGELLRLARSLEGSLTATLHLGAGEAERWSGVIEELARRAGRVIVDGVPTGVSVGHAIFHGGPWPSSTSARDTSVGSASIDRFLRTVCYQNVPDALLPPALQDANPLGIERLVDGRREGGPLGS